MAPTYVLSKSGNEQPKLQISPVNHKDPDYTGFAPVGWADIEARPFKDTFCWTTSYGRPYVDDQTKLSPKPKTQKSLSFRVITYRGLSGDDNFKSTEYYVYIGKSPYVRSVHENSYIHLVDLIARLGDNCLQYYEADFKAYDTAFKKDTSKQSVTIPFYAWNSSGTAPRSVRDQGWKVYYSELLTFESKYSTPERLFITYCAFASAAISPQEEPYTTLTRFFDTKVDDIHLYFRVDPIFDNNDNFSTFEKIVEQVTTTVKTRFIPATYEIVSSDDAKDDWELKFYKWRVGRHPQDLYDVWVRGDQMDKLHATAKIVRQSSDGNTGAIDEAKWLHRSAFSYGGLGESTSALSAQKPANPVLGTKATNSGMLRVEDFVKRYVLREGAKVIVKIQTQDPRNKLGDNKVWYLAPTLEYTYHSQTLDTNKNTHHYDLKSATRLFHCLDRYTPMRFDFEVGRLAEAEYFGWKDRLLEEEFETEEEDEGE